MLDNFFVLDMGVLENLIIVELVFLKVRFSRDFCFDG